MIKKHTTGYKGMSKDLARDKQSDKYFDAKNIRILATDQKSSFAVTNEAGNELVFEIPTPSINSTDTQIEYTVNNVLKTISYKTEGGEFPRCDIEASLMEDVGGTYQERTSGIQEIIGLKEMRDSALIVSTDSNGFDCYWELTGIDSSQLDINLLYINNLELSRDSLVQVLYNYENSVIQKVYMVDGKNQLRFFNIKQSVDNGDNVNLIDLPKSAIDTVSEVKTTQPVIQSVIDGGLHTSGMIQYACNFYRLNGSQTTISPLSELKAIGKGFPLGGGAVNEEINKSVLVEVPKLDKNFTHVKIYSIKYTSYNQSPEIKIVADREINSEGPITFVDTGGEAPSISIEEFTFLGSNPITPKHIATKDNRLFPVNIKEDIFDVEIDTRAYSFDAPFGQLRKARIGDSPSLNSQGDVVFNQQIDIIDSATTVTVNYDSVPEKFSSINVDYDKYKFRSDGVTLGGSGKYIDIELTQVSLSEGPEDKKFFKDNELYRLGIKFYNNRGQFTEPKWIMDIVAPEGNLQGNYNQLKVILNNEFYVWLNDSSNFQTESDKPVGYKMLRSRRDLEDRTIVAQGMLNSMIAHTPLTGEKLDSLAQRVEYADSSKTNKMPSVVRVFEDEHPFNANNTYDPLHRLCNVNGTIPNLDIFYRSNREYAESYNASSGEDMFSDEMQYGKMMQMFSPEVSFSSVSLSGLASEPLRVKGIAMKRNIECLATEVNPFTREDVVEVKFFGGINEYSPGITDSDVRSGSASFIDDNAFFGPTGGDGLMSAHQILRDFTGAFFENTNEKNWEVYGAPEVTERGQGFRAYNGDSAFNYSNNLKTMLQDSGIKGIWSNGEKCITIVCGPDNSNLDPILRPELKQLWLASSFGGIRKNGVLIAELIKEDSLRYVGSMYGGMSYSAKKSSTFIEIGDYQDINNPISTVQSPGDTFVHTYKFLKMARDDEWQESNQWGLLTEVVYVNMESSIDLNNRNDISFLEWDSSKHPKADDYQEYNNVYSQQPTLSIASGLGSKIKKIKEFDTRITSSKEKIPGEFVDNWTDMLENEYMDLDGKYGPINAVVNLRDEIFCLQDRAVAHISINPRAQVQAQDGIALELGTGGILHDYEYKSSEIGTLNKWGVIASEKAFYFVDSTTKGIMSFGGNGIVRLSDSKGLHYDLQNRMNNDLSNDNPVSYFGVSCGYSSVNSDVYFTFLQGGQSFTISFNENIGEFVSFYDYTPAWYLTKGDTMMTTDPSNRQLWQHFKGDPNHFYGTHYRSSMTMHVAPQGNEIILNNASYKIEITDAQGRELLNKGLTKVRVYNDYQDSGEIDLVMRRNVFNKFRNWKINLPRQKGSRDRIRSSWGFVEVIFDNTDKNRMILHDMTIFYTQH